MSLFKFWVQSYVMTKSWNLLGLKETWPLHVLISGLSVGVSLVAVLYVAVMVCSIVTGSFVSTTLVGPLGQLLLSWFTVFWSTGCSSTSLFWGGDTFLRCLWLRMKVWPSASTSYNLMPTLRVTLAFLHVWSFKAWGCMRTGSPSFKWSRTLAPLL